MTEVTLGPLDGDSSVTATVIITAATGDYVPISGVAGSVIRIYAILLVPGGTTNITFKNGSTAISGAIPFTSTQIMGPLMMPFSGQPYYTLSVGNSFAINSSAAVALGGNVWYTQNAAPLA